MNILLFVITLTVSFIAVSIGAVAFHLTGIEWSVAKFQALSCFSGAGFTTTESELITSHPQRRKIASVLIISGNVGLVTMIATFANSLRPTVSLPALNLPYLKSFIPPVLLPAINLIIIILSSVILFRIFTNKKFADKLTSFLKKIIKKKNIIKQLTFTNIAIIDANHGIARVKVCKGSPVVDPYARLS